MKRTVRIHPRSSNTLRAGFTLIELVAVVTLTLMIGGATCVLMGRMMRASQAQAHTLVQQRTLHLWEMQFRIDGRLSQSAVVSQPPEKARVEFQQTSGPVTYEVIAGGLERRVNGQLGGRWETGTGDWEFTLPAGDRVVRGELRHAEELSLSDSGRLPQGSTEPPKWSRIRVDVVIGSNHPGDK